MESIDPWTVASIVGAACVISTVAVGLIVAGMVSWLIAAMKAHSSGIGIH